ncbi:MAG: TIM barrel protein, partial [Nitratireductor sp.]
IDEAIAYADEIDANAIHVMAGCARGEQAHDCFLKNLEYASSNTSRTILIEALNPYDAPGYFLENTHQAANLIKELGVPNLKLMFDCYHVGRTEGDTVGNTEDNVEDRLKALLPIIGHIQFASTPLRGSPDTGELDYKSIFQTLKSFGWNKPLGAEYKPNGSTEDSLGWMQTLV